MPPKKRKKAVVPEAAFGAGQAGKTQIKPRSHAYGRKAVERSTARHLANIKSPPSKRSTSTQARGDAEMMQWIKKLDKDASITPHVKRRRGI